MSKTGLVLEGGAFRGVFTSGVVDVLIENNIDYPYVVGVSCGAGNGAGYLARQAGRTRNVVKPRDHKINYFGMKQVLRHGKFLNLDRMFFEYPYKEFPFDFDAYNSSDKRFEVVVSNCETGQAEYYDEREDVEKFLNLCKASCSIPIMCAPVKIGDYHYLDGSICDSVPMQRALDMGCDKLVIIMTKTRTETPTNYGKLKPLMAARYKRKYPRFYEALIQRTEVYKREIKLMRKLVKEGKALVLRPSIPCIHKFEQDDDKVEAFYQNGREVALANLDKLREFAASGSENGGAAI